MKKRILSFGAVLALLLVAAAAYVQVRFQAILAAPYAAPAFSIHEDVARADTETGRRIFHVRNGCVECHGVNLAGAKVMENGAMGSIWGANLTPAALGGWSDEDIARAIRYGIHKSGRSLHGMPSFDYQGLSKGDVAAVIAYVRSVPPVNRPSHENTFGPVAKVLTVLGKLPLLEPAFFVKPGVAFAEKPPEQADARFGEYLSHACAGCHGEELRGGPIPGGDPAWPEAANLRLGANPLWTEEAFRRLLRTGVSPRTNQPLRPPMPVAALRQLNETEAHALWQYLSSLK
jgi:mono/diheme cytochrome c family protein